MKIARNGGFILLAMLVLLITTASGFLLSALNQSALNHVEKFEQLETLRGLRDARLALIAHALIEDNTPGTLPAPSADNALTGRSSPLGYAGHPGQAARRLPWHFLALPPAPGGECLWYATSRIHRNGIPTAQRSSTNGNAINPATVTTLQFSSGPGLPLQSVAAVVMAPGRAVAGQTTRIATSGLSCTDGEISAFLENGNALPDAPFFAAAQNSASNDTVIALTHEQLMRPVLRRVLASFAGENMRQSILSIAARQNSHDTLEQIRCNPAPETTNCAGKSDFDAALANTSRERLAYAGACAGIKTDTGVTDYKQPVSWLCFNDWYQHIRLSQTRPALTLSLSDYHCELGLHTGQIQCRESPLP